MNSDLMSSCCGFSIGFGGYFGRPIGCGATVTAGEIQLSLHLSYLFICFYFVSNASIVILWRMVSYYVLLLLLYVSR